MEDTAAQAMTWIRIALLAALAVLMLIALAIQLRERKFGPVTTALRGAYGIAVFIALLLASGLTVNWLAAVALAVPGALAGYFAGTSSKIRTAEDGPRIKRSPWPAIVTAVAYLVAMVAALYGTADMFSVSLLLVLLAAMMTDGASVAEIISGTREKGIAAASAAVSD